jgi:GTPase
MLAILSVPSYLTIRLTSNGIISITFILILLQFKRSQLRKGMVMVNPVLEPKACWEFEAEVLILHHPTTISVKYQAMGM